MCMYILSITSIQHSDFWVSEHVGFDWISYRSTTGIKASYEAMGCDSPSAGNHGYLTVAIHPKKNIIHWDPRPKMKAEVNVET